MPALVALYCYRFGMELYVILSGARTTSLGYADPRATILFFAVVAASYLPVLVIIWTPFLPFQDALLRGQPRSFIDSVKMVLEKVWPYTLSSAFQGLVIMGPVVIVIIVAAVIFAAIPASLGSVRSLAIVLAMIPTFLWVIAAAFLTAFATPLVLLDDRGPVASVRESIGIIRRHFGGLFGRVFIFLLAIMFAGMFASLPSGVLSMVSAVAKQRLIGVEMARALWDSAVATATYPFTFAAVLILYRALVPGAGAPAVAEAPSAVALPLDDERTTATSPYPFE